MKTPSGGRFEARVSFEGPTIDAKGLGLWRGNEPQPHCSWAFGGAVSSLSGVRFFSFDSWSA